MARKVVCRVRSVEADGAIEFTWSEGSASFPPYAMRGELVGDFRASSAACRERLRDLVTLHEPADGDRSAEQIARGCLELAIAGRDLHNQIFDPSLGQAQEIGEWLRSVTDADGLESLEIVSEGQPWFVPWNVVYDREPDEAEFGPEGGDLACFEPFWGMKYNLCGGLPVDPLRRMPLPRDPSILFVLDPVVLGDLEQHAEAEGGTQRATLESFLAAHGVSAAMSKADLAKKLKASRPHMIYWLGHAEPEALYLGSDRIDLAELRRLLRGLPSAQGPGGGLVFLNACQTAGTSELGSFLKAFHDARFSGIIATEEQTLDNFANPFGLKALDEFLYVNRPIGAVLHELRRTNVPLGLLYGTYCPPDLRVRRADPADGRIEMKLGRLDSRRAGTMLGRGGAGAAAEDEAEAVEVATRLSLPPTPYLPLESFGPEHRALLVGRDDDVIRFSLTLDRPDTRVLVLHGESGVGKSSFLRAGVIPYLEEECIGYRFLRAPGDGRAGEADSPVLFVRATNDLAAQLAQAIARFCDRPYEYATPNGSPVTLDLSRRLADAIGASSPVDAGVLREALIRDPSLVSTLLTRLAAGMPRSPVLVIDQAEEVFTLTGGPDDSDARSWALEALAALAGGAGSTKVVVSLRTEYYGRLISALRRGSSEAVGVREYFLDDLDEAGTLEVILRPTLDEPVAGLAEIPRERYGFRYAEGVAEEIARQAIRRDPMDRKDGKDGVLPLIQVICGQLYDRLPRGEGGVIGREDLAAIGGVVGGIQRQAEAALAELLPNDPGERLAFRRLFTSLYMRHADGSVTTALVPEDFLATSWTGRTPFARVIADAARLRLLRLSSFRIGADEERPYVSLAHDTLARVASRWDEEFRRRERLRKFVVFSVGALAVAAIMAVLAVVAIVQANIASRERARAEKNLNTAIATIDDMLVHVGEIDLADVPQMEKVRKDLLLQALDRYRHFTWDSGPTSALLVPSALAETSLGDVLAMLGSFAEAEASYRGAIRALDPVVSRSPADVGARRGLARAREGLAQIARKTNRFDESSRELLAAIALRSGIPDESEKLNQSYYQLGTLLAKLSGRQAEAKAAYLRALDQHRPDSRGGGDKSTKPEDVATVYNNLAVLHEAGGDLVEARRAIKRAIEIQEPLFRSDARNPRYRWRLARSENNLASLLLNAPPGEGAGESDSAEILRLLSHAADLLAGLVSDFPSIPDYLKEQADIQYNLGLARRRTRDAGGAVAHFEKATDVVAGLTESYPRNPEYRHALARDEFELARLRRRDLPDLALNLLTDADGHLTALVETYPSVEVYRNDLRKVLADRATLEEQPDAVRTQVDRLIALEPRQKNQYLSAAILLADRPEDHERAVQILGLGIQRGMITSRDDLEKKAFGQLRDRPEFREMRDRLSGKSGPIKH